MGLPEVTLVVPTYNERENIPILVGRLESVLQDKASFEIIIVDDNSPDGTWQVAQDLASRKPHVRCLRRIDRRGLSSAVIDGFALARAPLLGVIDADLQHDETILPQMIAQADSHDVVIGSRLSAGGGIDRTWSWHRRLMSWTATKLAQIVLGVRISDPMTGYFLVQKHVFEGVAEHLNPMGFKILLEIIYRAKGSRVAEVGYVFRTRQHGESKLTTSVIMDYLWSLYDLLFGRVLSVQFAKFSLVGLTGALINLLVLRIGIALGLGAHLSLAAGIAVAMLSNFLLNNTYTFRTQKITGSSLGAALARYIAICSVGAGINYSVAAQLHNFGVSIYLGDILGIGVATAWNYVLNTRFTWSKR